MGIYFMCGKEHELSRTYGCKAKTNVAAAEKLSCDPGEEKDPAQAIGQVLLHQPALAGALLVLVLVHQDKLRMAKDKHPEFAGSYHPLEGMINRGRWVGFYQQHSFAFHNCQ